MKQRLCIGLISGSSILKRILDSIGVWYEEINNFSNLSIYPLIIIDGKPSLDKDLFQKIIDHKKNSGCIFEISTDPIFYKLPIKKLKIQSIYNTKTNSAFDRITHLDIHSKCALSTNTNLFDGLLDFEERFEGYPGSGFLGIDLRTLPTDSEYIRKKFLSTHELLPDEIVNKVSYDSLSDIIELSIQKLLHAQSLPFIKKWTSPAKNPIFCFRIDSDFGTKESIRNTYSFLDKHSIKATWFLHVKAHQHWLQYFNQFKNQELALHGFKHGYSNSISKISENIDLGLLKLKAANIYPSGFCAPYGIWNDALEKVVQEKVFLYTSEFTSGYGCLPFFQSKSNNLQIPIHPICTGSLNRKRCSQDDMSSYFASIFANKKGLFKPIIFYHHPLQSGFEVFNKIFEMVHEYELTNLTFKEYAEFWKIRDEFNFEAFLEDDRITINSNDNSLLLYVSNTSDSFDLISSGTQIISNELTTTFKYRTPSLPSEIEFNRLHENRLKLLKTSILDWNNRQRL